VKPSEAARAASPAAAVDVLPDPALPPAPGWRVSKLQYRPQHIIAGKQWVAGQSGIDWD
jgi:hypothetical protein